MNRYGNCGYLKSLLGCLSHLRLLLKVKFREMTKEQRDRWSEQATVGVCILLEMMHKQAAKLASEPVVQVLIILSTVPREVRERRLIYSLSQLVLTRHK